MLPMSSRLPITLPFLSTFYTVLFTPTDDVCLQFGWIELAFPLDDLSRKFNLITAIEIEKKTRVSVIRRMIMMAVKEKSVPDWKCK